MYRVYISIPVCKHLLSRFHSNIGTFYLNFQKICKIKLISIHYCDVNIRSWAHQDKHLSNVTCFMCITI